jgi:hypothetical protein
MRDRWGGTFHDQLSKVLLVDHDSITGDVPVVGLRNKLATDGYLGGETNDSCMYLVGNEAIDGPVDVSRVGRMQCPEDQEDLASAMAWSMEERCSRHLKSIFETGLSLRLFFPEFLDRCNVFAGVPTHVANADCDTVSHSHNA